MNLIDRELLMDELHDRLTDEQKAALEADPKLWLESLRAFSALLNSHITAAEPGSDLRRRRAALKARIDARIVAVRALTR